MPLLMRWPVLPRERLLRTCAFSPFVRLVSAYGLRFTLFFWVVQAGLELFGFGCRLGVLLLLLLLLVSTLEFVIYFVCAVHGHSIAFDDDVFLLCLPCFCCPFSLAGEYVFAVLEVAVFVIVD